MKSLAFLAMVLASFVMAQESRPAVEPTMPQEVTTPSGLKYTIMKSGTGAISPKMGDSVKVHYRGVLADGTEFDSSYKREEPTTFRLGQVIEGWNEGLTYMTVGAKYKFTIPPKLGYGENGTGPIPPNATLTFEVELLEITEGPRFRKGDPAKQQKTESGIVYEVVKDSDGATIKDSDVVVVRYTFWNTSSKLLQTCDPGKELRGTPKDMPLPFLKEAAKLMKVGQCVRFEAPPAMVFGAADKGSDLPPNSTTVWQLEVVRVVAPMPVPPFPAPNIATMSKTASGLQYQVLTDGDPKKPSPKMGASVSVHYAGWLQDGTLFDSSWGRGEPTEFKLGQVIAGWNEALMMMHPGASILLVIPPNLAYGARGSGPKIGPNATLVFRIDLLDGG